MKIVFMGTPNFAVGTLEALIADGHEIAGVVTQPDKPKGRSKTPKSTPVKEAALSHNLTVYQPKRVREPEFIQILSDICPDAIVVVAFGQIIPQAVLDIPRYGCINVHASLLPKYRGAAPIQWAVIDGERESGVTIMRMDAGLDTGDMIAKVRVPLDREETGGSLFDKLSREGALLCAKTLKEIENGNAVLEKQPADSPTPYAKMIDKKMGEIDWQKSAVSIERLIRGLNPWPSAYTFLHGKTLKIWKADAEDGEKGGTPGEVVSADKRGIRVCTQEGLLNIRELQLEGKKRMETEAFLRGCSVDEGICLGKANV